MNIVLYPNKVLREKAKEVKVFDEKLKKEVEEMIEVMRKGNGVGLAGNQVALLKQIVVLELEKGKVKVLINPKITRHSNDMCIEEEGCLSFPGIYGLVPRYKKVTVQYQDLEGRKHKIKANDFLAIALQHELDHLNGVLFIDHLIKISQGEDKLKELLIKSGEKIKLYE